MAFVEVIKHRTNVKPYAIFEIILTRSHEELKNIQQVYKTKYKKDLDKEIKSKSYSKNFQILKFEYAIQYCVLIHTKVNYQFGIKWKNLSYGMLKYAILIFTPIRAKRIRITGSDNFSCI